jgi:hypothetical protein
MRRRRERVIHMGMKRVAADAKTASTAFEEQRAAARTAMDALDEAVVKDYAPTIAVCAKGMHQAWGRVTDAIARLETHIGRGAMTRRLESPSYSGEHERYIELSKRYPPAGGLRRLARAYQLDGALAVGLAVIVMVMVTVALATYSGHRP